MEILVFAHWWGMKAPQLMGVLSVIHTKGHPVISFNYQREWLELNQFPPIDPDIQLYSGTQFLSGGKKNFEVFQDASPDRWGKVLMARRESLLAKKENRRPSTLREEDYLLGVFDNYRMGGIRLKKEITGPFLNDQKGLAAPPWTSLRELEFASLQLENEVMSDEEALKWLNLLIAPGASLGGARPKASVIDEKTNLWIAKFPSRNDTTDIGLWEMITNELAEKAGVRIASGMVKKFNNNYHTFLSKRFDRTDKGERIHFASAMTLLGVSDGEEGMSYLQIAEFILRNGANINADLEELWRRIVFNIAVKNTDDHLRNHGFLLHQSGWKLSPAFDINPVYFGTGLTLNISENDNSLDFELAKSVAKYFRISPARATEIISEVQRAVSGWRARARAHKVPASQTDQMAPAFEN